jgi:hypothetical protein
MAKIVRIGPNPNFRPSKDQAADWALIKGQAPKQMTYVSAMENVKLSGGMYAILPDPQTGPSIGMAIRMPEEMTRDELTLTALQLGIDMTRKQMKKAELIKAVRLKMDAVVLLDDDDEETDEGSGAE